LGHDRSKSDVRTNCDPVVDMGDLGFESEARHYYNDDLDYDKHDVASPCGLMARSFFNDTYTLHKNDDPDSDHFKIHKDDIAWEIDKDQKFKHQDDHKDKQWIDVKDKDFIVWMAPAGLPTFRKLYGKIEDDIDKGHYLLHIDTRYDVSDFDGKIYFVLSTTSGLGGKNEFLGILYLVIGGLSLLLAVLMLIIYFYKKRTGLN
jgi:hypothetical protein